MVKHILLLLLSGFLLFEADRAVAQKKLTGAIRGQVVDAASSGIEFASAILLTLPDSSLLKGVQTQENGRFHLSGRITREICFKNKFYRLCNNCCKRCSCSSR